MKILSPVAFASIWLISPVVAQNVINFDSETARDASNLKSLNFKSRITVPYGPDLLAGQSSSDKPWLGYGFGVGAGENIAYDAKNHYLYVSNQQGYATVVDFMDPTSPKVTDFTLDYRGISVVGEGNDVTICPEQGWIFIAVKNEGVVLQIAAVQRTNPEQPHILQKIPTDNFPRQLLAKTDCGMLVVANENDDELTTGSITLIRKLDTKSPEVTIVALDANGWEDDYPLSKGLHMPLTKNALEYWDDYSHLADQLDFSEVRAQYRSSIFIESETLTWGNVEETELIVNLQINNGILRVDVVNDKPVSLAGYGLKDHGEIPIDIDSKDKACDGKTYANFFSMRNPDSVKVVRYNGKQYLLTANEGDNKDYFGFSDQIAAADIFQGETFGLKNMKVPTSVFNPDASLGGAVTSPFNANCTGSGCVGSVTISVGSSAIDYQLDAKNPTFQRMVAFGGRGFTIYELPDDPDALLKLVYDSTDEMERTTCEHLPWAYNSIHSDDYAPASNMPNNTAYQFADAEFKQALEDANDPLVKGCYNQGDGTPGACPMKKLMDSMSESLGPTVEALVAGVACGRLVTVMSTGLSSVAWLYDITEIANPRFLKIFHLSEASKDYSPGLAYNNGELGEIDAENMVFLSADESPSGKAAIIFGGSHSGSFSFWEFECGEYEDVLAVQRQEQQSSASQRTILGSFLTGILSLVLMLR